MPALRRQPIGAALALMLLTPVGPALAAEDAVARGEYLVRASGCFSCHTDGLPHRPLDFALLGRSFTR
jgi:hypothetical protein